MMVRMNVGVYSAVEDIHGTEAAVTALNGDIEACYASYLYCSLSEGVIVFPWLYQKN